jgi:hypothetical protein
MSFNPRETCIRGLRKETGLGYDGRRMRREGDRRVQGCGQVGLVLVLAGLIAPCLLPVAAEGKKTTSASTRKSSTAVAPGSQRSRPTSCPHATHITGGGWLISPPFNPNGTSAPTDDTGARSLQLQSQSQGFKSWRAGAAIFSSSPAPGTLTTFARCERNIQGRETQTTSGSSTLSPGEGANVLLHCPAGTRVVTGGFSGSPAGDLAVPQARRIIILESRRLNSTTWEVRAVNPNGAPSQATIAANAVCEKIKGVNTTEVASVAPIATNARSQATATCPKGRRVSGGGFQISPVTSPLPAVAIDQSQPLGQRSWQIGLYELPELNSPSDSFVTTYSYCRKPR